MKIKSKAKLASMVLAIFVLGILVTLSGCATQGNSTVPQTSKEETVATGDETSEELVSYPQFTIWMGEEKKSPEITEVQKLLKKELGFDFKVQPIIGDLMTAVSLKLASGGFEDMAVFWKNDTITAAMSRSGLVKEIEPLLNNPKYPNLSNIPQEIIDRSKDTNGKLWFVPGWYAQELDNPWPGWGANAWWVRQDVLEELGMSLEDLSTIEGFEQFLEKSKELTDANGNPLLPLGFIINEGSTLNHEEDILLSTFGVEMAGGISGMPGVKKDGNNFIFAYDDPNFKRAYQWANKLYNSGLIDQEVITQKPERFKEKINNEQYAALLGTMWKADLNNIWFRVHNPEENGSVTFTPIKNPAVSGVDKPGSVAYVNPYPATSIFISKNTKNLDSILAFMDWCQEPKPERQQEINEGPIGINWFWTNEPYGEWDFEENYKVERNSGDQARVDALTPQLYMLGTYSNKWYPWWTNAFDEGASPFQKMINIYTARISQESGTFRVIHSYDNVPAVKDGVMERYLPTISTVYIEYRAKLLLAKTTDEFEKVWNDFKNALEQRGHWSEIKEEWHREYQNYIKQNGDY